VPPSALPTTSSPTAVPTIQPTNSPTINPSATPSSQPTIYQTSSCPTTNPVALPTQAPTPVGFTAYPTSSTPVVVDVTQVVSGCSYESYQSQQSEFTNTLMNAVVSSVSGITIDDFAYFKVSSTISTNSHMLQLATTSSGILLTYSLSTNNAQVTTTSLTDQLVSATSNGVFNNFMSYYADVYSATGLDGAYTQPATVTTPEVDTSDDEGLSGGAIAGIVIGVLAGVGILGSLLYYYYSNPRQKESNLLGRGASTDYYNL
jgi:cell wall integrity and stress response component